MTNLSIPPHDAWLQTFTGKPLDLIDPKPEQVDILDIALGLSRIPRWNGQTSRFYSVAEHSIAAAALLRQEDGPLFALIGLLHDASEAYLGDVPKPLKRILPEYEEVESRLMSVVFKKYGLPASLPPKVEEVDARLLATEYRDLFGVKLFDLALPPYENLNDELTQAEALSLFLGTFDMLLGELAPEGGL